jgi:serine/threonine-protein kinase
MAEAARETRTGELLNEAYELHERLEEGGTFDIYRATDRKGERTVRVKLLRPEFALQSNVVQGFLREPRTWSGLRHPNVSQVLAVESDETGIPFVVEEHVDGEPLARTLERFPAGMPLRVAIDLLLPVTEALAAAHELGVAHGRIDRDHVLVAKLGAASVPKLVRFASTRPPRAAGAGAARGERLAPELRDGKATADARSDVWALGALLYETLCGKPPAAAGKHAPLDERAPEVPAELAAIVERCLSFAPEQRPQRLSAVRDALSATRDRIRPAPAQAKTNTPSHLRSKPRPPVGRNTAAARKVALPALDTAPAADPKAGASFALSATVFAQQAAAAPAAVDEMVAFPCADDAVDAAARDTTVDAHGDEPVLELTAEDDGDEDEPEITLEGGAGPTSHAPRAPRSGPPVEIKTMSDLAAAFGPIEGEDRIGQAMTARSEQPEGAEPDAAETRGKQGKGKDKKKERDKAAPLLSRKALVEKNAAARPLSEEQLRQLRERTQQGERRRGRYALALLFLLFAFALLFAVPLLVDPTRTKAQELLGSHTQLAVAGFAILSVVALVRTWALQINARPVMLRPVTIALKVVTAAVCVLASAFFLPSGALGPAEVGARAILPWASALFYLFLTLYGLMRAIREASSNLLQGLAIAALYTAALFGSYRVLTSTVLAGAGAAARGVAGVNHKKTEGALGALHDYVVGDARREQKSDAGVAEEVSERKMAGASEADDMRNIEEMEQSRKRKGVQLENLGKSVDEIIR